MDARIQKTLERSRHLQRHWPAVGPETITLVREIVEGSVDRIVQSFYDVLLELDEAGEFLSSELVQTRLRKGLSAWLRELVSTQSETDPAAVIRHQYQVGELHARINLPLPLLSLGVRVLKRSLADVIFDHGLEPAQARQAMLWLSDTFDQMVECMEDAYVGNLMSHARNDQTLRLFMVGHGLALECERLRSNLFEWQRSAVLMLVEDPSPERMVGSLARCDLGLWLTHKARLAVGETPEYTNLEQSWRDLCSTTEAIAEKRREDPTAPTGALAAELSERVDHVAFLVKSIADRALKVEDGRDPLTRLFSRRYLPSVLQNEIEISRRSHRAFALLVVDVDRFKEVNDRFGHQAGDAVLVVVAEVLQSQVRPNDYLFRYGGEEFLLLLTEVDQGVAVRRAEEIRAGIEQADFGQGAEAPIAITVSIGVAIHDGHPDYQRVLNAADAALYVAKTTGRNRVAIATPD